MNYFDLVQEFIDHSERATSADELALDFQRAIGALGFRYFACCSHVDPLRPPRRAVVIHTYPAAWIHLYSEHKWFQIDPILRRADATLLPFFWDSNSFRTGLTPEGREILSQASEFGIAHGFTIPIHQPCAQVAYAASCSVVPDSLPLARPHYQAVQLMSYYMYETACRAAETKADVGSIELSNRERQCLELVAQGKSDWVVGKLLSISERTVHNHIERAKRRLGVTTRVQAIVHALATRQISFGDVVKAESARALGTSTSKTHRSDA